MSRTKQSQSFYIPDFDSAFADVTRPPSTSWHRLADRYKMLMILNLLLGRNILIRFMDLYNNPGVALMLERLSSQEKDALKSLVQKDLIRVVIPKPGAMLNVVENWAVGQGGQYWHHLQLVRQLEYARRVRNGSDRLCDIEDIIDLGHNFGLNIYQMIHQNDSIFGGNYVTAPPSAQIGYGDCVLRNWEACAVRLARDGMMAIDINAMTSFITDGINRGYKRREFFSQCQLREGVTLHPKVCWSARRDVWTQSTFDSFCLGSVRAQATEKSSISRVAGEEVGFSLGLENMKEHLAPASSLNFSDILNLYESDALWATRFQVSAEKLNSYRGRSFTWVDTDLNSLVSDHIGNVVEWLREKRKIGQSTDLAVPYSLRGVPGMRNTTRDEAKSLLAFLKAFLVAAFAIFFPQYLGHPMLFKILTLVSCGAWLIDYFLGSSQGKRERREFELGLEALIRTSL